MLSIRIHGIKDGKHPINLATESSNIRDLPEEFFGKIELDGIMTKIGKRYAITAELSCNARMICDISLEEFTETIKTSFECTYHANTDLYMLNKSKGTLETESGEIIIHEDDQELDISEQVRQELLLNLPMKRIAPAYRDKSFQDIYPEFIAGTPNGGEIDERWRGLQNLNLDD